eukprot:1577259-Pyramimonas_sp.AAC.1
MRIAVALRCNRFALQLRCIASVLSSRLVPSALARALRCTPTFFNRAATNGAQGPTALPENAGG